MPPMWETYFDRGREFFYNAAGNISTWRKEGNPTTCPPPPPNSTACPPPPPPWRFTWVRYFDDRGVPYFHSEELQITKWFLDPNETFADATGTVTCVDDPVPIETLAFADDPAGWRRIIL